MMIMKNSKVRPVPSFTGKCRVEVESSETVCEAGSGVYLTATYADEDVVHCYGQWVEECTWHPVDEYHPISALSFWRTECGEDSIRLLGMKFCCYCGKVLVGVVPRDEEEES